MSEVRVIRCDACQRNHEPNQGELTRLSCGHDVCQRHHMTKNERGEIQCPRRCGSVYIKEIVS